MPIIKCGNKEFNICEPEDNSGSEYVKDMMSISGSADVVIPIPDKYGRVIDNYLDFIKPTVMSEQTQDSCVNTTTIPITSRQRLLLCLQLSTLLVDDNYFKYCVQQVFNNWSYMCTMVYTDLNDDLQWSIFLHSPYDFIPKQLLNNSLFMTRWNDANQNTIIKVNKGNETYYNNVITMNYRKKCITTSHTVNNNQGEVNNNNNYVNHHNKNHHVKEVGYKKVVTYCEDSDNITVEKYYNDDKREGVWKEWYEDEQNMLWSEEHYVNGKKHGLCREWSGVVQDRLLSEGHYVNGEKHGLHTEWYDNDQHLVSDERHYDNGKQIGTWRGWHSNPQHTISYETPYVNGKAYGLYKEWHNNDKHTLSCEGQEVDNKRHGLWHAWYNNDEHTLWYEGHYVDGKMHGVWKEWYNNKKHTLKYKGHYVNGKRNKHWEEFDIHGKVTFDGYYINDVKSNKIRNKHTK